MQVIFHKGRLCPAIFQLVPEDREALISKEEFSLILSIYTSHPHKLLVRRLSSNAKCFLHGDRFLCRQHSWKLVTLSEKAGSVTARVRKITHVALREFSVSSCKGCCSSHILASGFHLFLSLKRAQNSG